MDAEREDHYNKNLLECSIWVGNNEKQQNPNLGLHVDPFDHFPYTEMIGKVEFTHGKMRIYSIYYITIDKQSVLVKIEHAIESTW